MDNRLKTAYVLSIIGFLFIICIHYDYILFLSIVFTASLVFSYAGGLRGRLVWFGVVLYLVYMSLHYLISAGTEYKFALLITLIIFTIVCFLIYKTLSIQDISTRFSEKTPVKTMAAFLALNVLLILGELPVYFVLKYHLYYHGYPGLFITFLLFIFIDVVILGSLHTVVIVQLIRRKAFGYVLAPVIFVMNTLLWFKSYFLFNLLDNLTAGSISGAVVFYLSPFPFLFSLILSFVSMKHLENR